MKKNNNMKIDTTKLEIALDTKVGNINEEYYNRIHAIENKLINNVVMKKYAISNGTFFRASFDDGIAKLNVTTTINQYAKKYLRQCSCKTHGTVTFQCGEDMCTVKKSDYEAVQSMFAAVDRANKFMNRLKAVKEAVAEINKLQKERHNKVEPIYNEYNAKIEKMKKLLSIDVNE